MTKDGTNDVVQSVDLEVEVKHSFPKNDIDFEKQYFTEINFFYSEENPKGQIPIYYIYSLNQLLERLNTWISTGKKIEDPAILKGIYNGGTSGGYCDIPAGFLFCELDVKDNENPHLKCNMKNAKAFEIIQKYALLTWRSNSGLGIAFIVYVPQLADIGNNKTEVHLQIGKTITSYLSKELKRDNVVISFDDAQSKFRQPRFLAEQKEQRSFNPSPALFEYTITETPRVYASGVKAYRNKDYRPIAGSIEEQYNNRNNIKNTLSECGFQHVAGDRWKHHKTTSGTSGFVKEIENEFVNFSGSFGRTGGFRPFDLVRYYQYNNDKDKFLKALIEQGYKDIEPTKEAVKNAQKTLSRSTKNRDKEIFAVCRDLQNLPFAEKLDFINTTCKVESERPYFEQYLKVKSLSIKYDATLKIDKHVSEVFSDILNLADQHKKVIEKAETGTGKTYSVINEFPKLRPDKSCLIIAPLTVIVDQAKTEFNIIGLTGSSDPIEFQEAFTAKMVIATQEQAIKLLKEGIAFDYIVVDEMHNLLTANSYKREVLEELTFLLRDEKVIGLTATPNAVFSKIGYKVLSVEKRSQSRTKVIQRASNLQGYKIILEHQKSVTGKSAYRINSKKAIHDIKNELIENHGYIESDFFIIYSENEIKQSEDFRGMIHKQQFPEDAKIILTTSIIDEGMNIYQEGFTDVVFIDSEYTPRPESQKQFFARFRNDDPKRQNYHYRKFKKDQEIVNWNWEWDYNKRFKNAVDEVDGLDDFNSYKDLADDGNFYYPDHSINKYYLGYSVTEQLFERLTIAESNEYLRQNYNLDIEVDAVEFESNVSTDRQKRSATEKHATLHKRWNIEDNREDIKQLVRKYTSDIKLKKRIEKNNLFRVDENSNLPDEVKFYLSDFERLISETEKLKTLTNINPDGFLFDANKLRNIQKYNRLVLTLENRQVIDNPQNKYDHKNREKIINFLNDAMKLEEFQIRDLQKLWAKQRVTNIRGYKSFYLLDLLVDNLPGDTKITENKELKTYSFLHAK